MKILRFAFSLVFLFAPLAVSAQGIPNISVSDHCTVQDQNGGSHSYTSQFLGVCALAAAKQQGAVSAYELTFYDAFGLFLQSLNGTTPTASQYWSISQNGAEAQVGLSSMTVAQGDVLSFQLTDWTNNTQVGSPVSFAIVSLVGTPPPAPAPSGGGGGLTLHDPFDVQRARSFLWSKQGTDGSFGSSLMNDWIAIASAGGGAGDMRKKLIEYEKSNQPTLSGVTDYERHAMALEALGINPYSGTPVDYIAPIVRGFDGTQIGDAALVNDDIFAIFPLLHAGYTLEDEVIAKTAQFILSKQHADGSWEGSVDLTAAAVQALSLPRALSNAPEAVNKALGYLHTRQEPDGGFKNASATAWVLQAVAAAQQSVFDWSAGTYRTPDYYLATKQELDGGVEPQTADVQTRLWATAYAIPAIEHKTWDALLASFEKPAPPTVATTTLAATTTIEALIAEIASSTLPASSTEPASSTAPAPEGLETNTVALPVVPPTQTEPPVSSSEPRTEPAQGEPAVSAEAPINENFEDTSFAPESQAASATRATGFLARIRYFFRFLFSFL